MHHNPIKNKYELLCTHCRQKREASPKIAFVLSLPKTDVFKMGERRRGPNLLLPNQLRTNEKQQQKARILS